MSWSRDSGPELLSDSAECGDGIADLGWSREHKECGRCTVIMLQMLQRRMPLVIKMWLKYARWRERGNAFTDKASEVCHIKCPGAMHPALSGPSTMTTRHQEIVGVEGQHTYWCSCVQLNGPSTKVWRAYTPYLKRYMCRSKSIAFNAIQQILKKNLVFSLLKFVDLKSECRLVVHPCQWLSPNSDLLG